MYDIIEKKRDGGVLSEAELYFFARGAADGSIPDYQLSALLMAIYLKGMNAEETVILTKAMAESGDTVDLSAVDGITVDKHSTGGVGDKTTLIVAPVAAACGVKVAKMSGRGLGHTGGTVDKLESIPGFKTALSREEFFAAVNKNGLAVIGQSGNLCPADKKLYALRDVTATIGNLSLIASSIMSKKLAAGSECIVLDVKTGSGAFMRSRRDAYALAQAMVSIGNTAGRKTRAILTDMDVPLGKAIGNTLEVIEAVEILEGRGDPALYEVCMTLAANMLELAGKGSPEQCRALAESSIRNGSALEKLALMTASQGGDRSYIDNPSKFPRAKHSFEIKAERPGFVGALDALACGTACVLLGAGRVKKEDIIDPLAGIILEKKPSDCVKSGDVLAVLYASSPALFEDARALVSGAFSITDEPFSPASPIIGTVG